MTHLKHRYKSKVGWLFKGAMIIVIASIICSNYFIFGKWVALICNLVYSIISIALIGDIYYNTYYEVEQDVLTIKCGIFYYQKIKISNITRIEHKSTILSSPSLDTQRICIIWGKRSEIYISPVNEEEFIAHLHSINHQIEIV